MENNLGVSRAFAGSKRVPILYPQFSLEIFFFSLRDTSIEVEDSESAPKYIHILDITLSLHSLPTNKATEIHQ